MKKTLIYILYFISLSTYIQAQTTAIPDAAFEQKLIALGIDSDGLVNGQILNSDAASVILLDIDSSNITDLTGIAAFVNLDTLTCHANNLTTLDLSANTTLIYLSCGGNNLASLDVSMNTALTELLCWNNHLTTLDFSANTALVNLYCPNNNLVTLNVSTNAALEELSCSDNNLTTLDLSGCSSLDDLNCINNNLAMLDISTNTGLVYLQCAGNSFTNLDASNHLVLRHIECANNNNLTTLNVSGCTSLGYLGCYNTSLTDLDISSNVHLDFLYCDNANLTYLDASSNLGLSVLSCMNNNLAHLDLTNHQNTGSLRCQGNEPYLQICVPDVQQALNNSSWLKDISATFTENCSTYSLAVVGKIAIDSNSNCLVDSLEHGLIGQLIKFEKLSDNSISYSSSYDSLGSYRAFLDTGTYTVTVIPSNNYWQVCPSSQQITIDTNYNIQTLNWSLQELISCPFMQVDIAAPFLRMAGGGSRYTVSYCNTGTVSAQGSYIEVDIDGDLNVLSSTLPIASQVGTIYTFNLGMVEIGDCGSFNIQVVVDTSAQFGQTHCTEAHIYPDSICNSVWNGPRINGSVNCQNSQVNFIIENRGAAMLSPQPYTIFEDNIAMRVGTVNLGVGQSTTIAQGAAIGKTYRIEVNQALGFPSLLGDLIFSSTIEGCNPFPNGSFNTGFVTQFSNGHSAPFMAIDCQQNVGSYDPNDKTAQPAGYGVQHYMEQNIALDYKIRFQNTGTDTAFNIVILDTLSSYLSISSLQMGASSHSYDWEIINGNVLKVSFPNILLVDSNANESLSHGFFRYRINQNINNPIGSIIENSAAIYFDYNPAIITNTTFHRIGEHFVISTVSIDQIYEKDILVQVFPNPFTYSTTIKVEGKIYNELELTVFDISGRVVAQEQSSQGSEIQFAKGNLHEGIYIYQLKGDGVLLNTGKVMVQ